MRGKSGYLRKSVSKACHLDIGFKQGFAVFTGQQPRPRSCFFGIGIQTIGNMLQLCGACLIGQRGPAGKGILCRLHRRINIMPAGSRCISNGFSRTGRIDKGIGDPASSRTGRAVNE